MHRKHVIDPGTEVTEGSGAWGVGRVLRWGLRCPSSGKVTTYLQGSNTIVLPLALIFGIWFDVFPIGIAHRPIQLQSATQCRCPVCGPVDCRNNVCWNRVCRNSMVHPFVPHWGKISTAVQSIHPLCILFRQARHIWLSCQELIAIHSNLTYFRLTSLQMEIHLFAKLKFSNIKCIHSSEQFPRMCSSATLIKLKEQYNSREYAEATAYGYISIHKWRSWKCLAIVRIYKKHVKIMYNWQVMLNDSGNWQGE